jgi:hypothetical protein
MQSFDPQFAISTAPRTVHEVRAVLSAALFFGAWIAGLILLKQLMILEGYSIEFHRYALVLMGALVLSKVVLILGHVPLPWKMGPAWLDVVRRGALYTAGMLLEKSFETRHEYGGMGAAARISVADESKYEIFANTICTAAAFNSYHTIDVIRRNVGVGGFRRMFSEPVAPPRP